MFYGDISRLAELIVICVSVTAFCVIFELLFYLRRIRAFGLFSEDKESRSAAVYFIRILDMNSTLHHNIMRRVHCGPVSIHVYFISLIN